MATLEWAQLCELAFFDSCQRLCLIGVTTKLPVPCLPLAVHQLMIAARVTDAQPGDDVGLRVAVLAPSGRATTPAHATDLDITMSSEFVLVTLRDIPLSEEGVYRVVISADGGEPISLDVPVLLASRPSYADVH